MNVTLRRPRMSREQFLDWVERQEKPYEFDGFDPVPMTGGTVRHALLCSNLMFSLRRRLEDTVFDVLLEAGIATGDGAVRYPDVLIRPSGGELGGRLVSNPVVVFEVVSPSSGRIDRYFKLREYRSVPTIRRYVIVDEAVPEIAVFARTQAHQEWTADALSFGDTLVLPELGIGVPVEEVFRNTGLTAD